MYLFDLWIHSKENLNSRFFFGFEFYTSRIHNWVIECLLQEIILLEVKFNCYLNFNKTELLDFFHGLFITVFYLYSNNIQ